ncbi:MAG: DNA gyrase modulator, partial [Spirochaetota bacterium]
MQYDLRRLLDAATAGAPGATWVGLRKRRTATTSHVARDGTFDQSASNHDEGIMVEVLHSGQFGYAATPDLSPAGVAAAARLALMTAKSAAGRGVHDFDASVRPPTKATYSSHRLRKAPVAPDGIFAFLFDACAALKADDKVIQTLAMVESGRSDFELVSTAGADIEQSLHYIGTTLQAVARDGEIVQRRTANGPRSLIRQGGWELLDMAGLLEKAAQVGNEAVELLSAEPCPSDRRTLVLAPGQMILQIHESVGHPLELDRILG